MIGQNIPAPPAAAGVGGSTGSVDNAILRADGTGGATLQSADISIDDATTSTQNNVAITNQHSGQTNSALVLTPKGTGAFILGPKPDGTAVGGNARGARASDFQKSRGSASQVASGADSVICGGANNTASVSYSTVVGGLTNSVSGNGYQFIGGGLNNNISAGWVHVLCGGERNSISSAQSGTLVAGQDNSTSGSYASILGGSFNSATASYSSALGGFRSLSDRYGMQAYSSGPFLNTGDAQRARFVLRCKTTTNAAVEMALNGSTTYLTIPSGKVMFMNIKVVGSKSDGTAVATYERQYAVKNVGGTSSQVYAPITIGTDNAAGTTIEVATVDAGDYVRIRPTGIASETWRWVASVDAVEVAYGT